MCAGKEDAMTDTDALIELLVKLEHDTYFIRNNARNYLQHRAIDLAREVIALRAEIARLTEWLRKIDQFTEDRATQDRVARALTPTTGDKDKGI